MVRMITKTLLNKWMNSREFRSLTSLILIFSTIAIVVVHEYRSVQAENAPVVAMQPIPEGVIAAIPVKEAAVGHVEPTPTPGPDCTGKNCEFLAQPMIGARFGACGSCGSTPYGWETIHVNLAALHQSGYTIPNYDGGNFSDGYVHVSRYFSQGGGSGAGILLEGISRDLDTLCAGGPSAQNDYVKPVVFSKRPANPIFHRV